jgi:hypothetical protein
LVDFQSWPKSGSKPEAIPSFQATKHSDGLVENGRSPRGWRNFAGTEAKIAGHRHLSSVMQR